MCHMSAGGAWPAGAVLSDRQWWVCGSGHVTSCQSLRRDIFGTTSQWGRIGLVLSGVVLRCSVPRPLSSSMQDWQPSRVSSFSLARQHLPVLEHAAAKCAIFYMVKAGMDSAEDGRGGKGRVYLDLCGHAPVWPLAVIIACYFAVLSVDC